MGTGTSHTNTQKQVSSKPPRCSICRQAVRPDCDWNQGRCPHRPESATITIVRSRIRNLIKLFTGTK